MTEGQHEDDQRGGRQAVRELLLERLTDAGLRRRKGVSAEAQARSGEALAEHLAYLAPENLMTLAETLIDAATDGQMPSEWLIRSWAHALEAPPPADRRIVTSWLASIEGPNAEGGGYLVELYRWLMRNPRPPGPMDMRAIRETAAENNRNLVIIAERVQPSAEELAWREAYLRDQAAARRLVEAGRAKRARQQQQQAGTAA